MGAIIDFFVHIWDNIVNAFSDILSWLLSLLENALNSLLAPLAESLPDLSSYWSNLQQLSPYTATINTFIPLHEAGIFIAAFFVFIFVFITVKLIVKIFVPFVG